ncbi:hypothetical protein [Methyloglobulus sp.]|uniref:hypothetical protein n=1 Tax=Methyloglobulus sp. TaxID=2518622 RepID=UPI0039898D24
MTNIDNQNSHYFIFNKADNMVITNSISPLFRQTSRQRLAFTPWIVARRYFLSIVITTRSATCRSSRFKALSAFSSYSTFQAKFFPYLFGSIAAAFSGADIFKGFIRQINIFHVFKALLDNLAQIIRLCAASLGG